MTHQKRPFSNLNYNSSGGGSSNNNSGNPPNSMKKEKSQQESESMIVDQQTGVASNLSRKKATPPQPTIKKALKIKLNKEKPKLPPNFEEDTWATLKSAITAIFLKKPDPCDSEKLYQAVNDLCIHKMGGNLYQHIRSECEVHISAALQSLIGQSPDLVVFLSLVEKCWQDFSDQMLIIRSIALYLDRTYVKQTNGVDSLWEMGLKLFEKHLSINKEVSHKIVTGLLRLIERERYHQQKFLIEDLHQEKASCKSEHTHIKVHRIKGSIESIGLMSRIADLPSLLRILFETVARFQLSRSSLTLHPQL